MSVIARATDDVGCRAGAANACPAMDQQRKSVRRAGAERNDGGDHRSVRCDQTGAGLGYVVEGQVQMCATYRRQPSIFCLRRRQQCQQSVSRQRRRDNSNVVKCAHIYHIETNNRARAANTYLNASDKCASDYFSLKPTPEYLAIRPTTLTANILRIYVRKPNME